MESKIKTTTKPTNKPSTADKIIDQNKKLRSTLRTVKMDNIQLSRKFEALHSTMNLLTKQLKEEKYKNSTLTEKFNKELLEDEDCQCIICYGVFIKPSLLSCSHMFCEWCIDKSLERYNYCPACRVVVVSYTHCLNMSNFIQRKMALMPEKFQLAYKNLSTIRAEEKQLSTEIREQRMRLEYITMQLNGHRST
ncbi:PREDICTED: E3 ubiquitin-protein ligase RNF8-like [Diuraphis noxia]|uniref:E3 ubiquitin-protein ligase RNF8-like n=1 Tax=Diuraphis noxia TaxID=143948 RepID=UPI0007639A5F|nr:PREDICTED: E3 ubiquitin-protein ligase RNF8-like [Diuraphis noxia]